MAFDTCFLKSTKRVAWIVLFEQDQCRLQSSGDGAGVEYMERLSLVYREVWEEGNGQEN